MDFTVPVDHRVKQKESEKKTEKLWNMKVAVILIKIGAFNSVTKGLVQGLEGLEIRGRVETIQTTISSRLT